MRCTRFPPVMSPRSGAAIGIGVGHPVRLRVDKRLIEEATVPQDDRDRVTRVCSWCTRPRRPGTSTGTQVQTTWSLVTRLGLVDEDHRRSWRDERNGQR